MELKLTQQELNYLTILIEQKLDNVNETDYDEAHQEMMKIIIIKLIMSSKK